jgi:hypothetical protein
MYVQRRLAPRRAVCGGIPADDRGSRRLPGGPALRRSSARSVLLPPATPPAAWPRSGASSRSLAWRAGSYMLDPIRCTSRSAPARVYPAPNRRQMTSVIPNTKVQ